MNSSKTDQSEKVRLILDRSFLRFASFPHSAKLSLRPRSPLHLFPLFSSLLITRHLMLQTQTATTSIPSYTNELTASPTSSTQSPLWFPRSHRSASDMSLSMPNPYASMEIPIDTHMLRKESQDLHELQMRDVERLSNTMGAGLDLAVRENDKAEASKLRQAAATGGGGGPK